MTYSLTLEDGHVVFNGLAEHLLDARRAVVAWRNKHWRSWPHGQEDAARDLCLRLLKAAGKDPKATAGIILTKDETMMLAQAGAGVRFSILGSEMMFRNG